MPIEPSRGSTHEDQGGVQILFMLLEEFSVVLLRHLVVVLVEFSLMVVLICGKSVLVPPERQSE